MDIDVARNSDRVLRCSDVDSVTYSTSGTPDSASSAAAGRTSPGRAGQATSATTEPAEHAPSASPNEVRSANRPPIQLQPAPTSMAPPSTMPRRASDAPRSLSSGAT